MASASAERRLAVLAGQAVTTTGGCYGKEVSQSYLANGDALGEQAQAQLENRRKSGGQASTGQVRPAPLPSRPKYLARDS